ncbi:hypothetical protein [Streptomyces sp. NPDC001502]|uniref:hypothetical protein n=1 Tax=Streptomyces sp. NPDC001502 TaxID=3364578 RepID=UPI0036B384F0
MTNPCSNPRCLPANRRQPAWGEGNSPAGIVDGHCPARLLLCLGRHVRVIAEPDQCGGRPDAVDADADADAVEGSVPRLLGCGAAFARVEAAFLADGPRASSMSTRTRVRRSSASGHMT